MLNQKADITESHAVARQVVKDLQADRVEQLGFNKTVGAALVFAWPSLLVAVIILRRQTDYSSWKQLHWFESFYRTGSIVFFGGQVRPPLIGIMNPKP